MQLLALSSTLAIHVEDNIFIQELTRSPAASYPLRGLPCPTATTSTWWQCARDQVCERVPLWLNGLQFALIAKTVYRLEGSDFTLVYDTFETGTRLPIFSNRHTNATVLVHFP